MPPSISTCTYACTYACTTSDPNLSEPKNSPTASTRNRAAPALVRFRCLLHAGALAWGRAPRWNIETDLTPPAAATLSRDPTRFGC